MNLGYLAGSLGLGALLNSNDLNESYQTNLNQISTMNTLLFSLSFLGILTSIYLNAYDSSESGKKGLNRVQGQYLDDIDYQWD